MRKIDKDGNGTFEKSESGALWRRYRKLDANRDGVISIEELRKAPVPYLETGGERKLDIVYKKIDQRELRLAEPIGDLFSIQRSVAQEQQRIDLADRTINAPA